MPAALLDAALASDGGRALGYGLQQAVNGAVVAAFYSLLAVSYALLHGITGRIVLSFGEIAMFGAFVASYMMLMALVMGTQTGIALVLVFLAAAGASAALGYSAQRGVFGPLIASPSQAVMIASIGLSIAIQELMRLQSGGREQWLPPFLGAAALDADPGGFSVRATWMQAVVVALALGLLGALAAVLTFTRWGRLWRACAQNRELAALCGIDARAVMFMTALAAGAFAGAAGWIVAVSYGTASPYMGLMLGLKALFASILGGFGTLAGAAAGGIVLAALETVWTAYFPTQFRDVAVFGLIVLILILKPDGLLGTGPRRESEA